MKKEELAKILHGREYGNEITKEDERLAKQNDLIIITGYSDDNVEIYGYFREELPAWNGTSFSINEEQIFEDKHECNCMYCNYEIKRQNTKFIEAIWCDESLDPKICWTFKTEIPHATFDIMEDGEIFSRGIVISLDDLN